MRSISVVRYEPVRTDSQVFHIRLRLLRPERLNTKSRTVRAACNGSDKCPLCMKISF